MPFQLLPENWFLSPVSSLSTDCCCELDFMAEETCQYKKGSKWFKLLHDALAPCAGCITSNPSGFSIKIDKLEKEQLSSFMHSFKFFMCDVSVCGRCWMSPGAAASTGLREPARLVQAWSEAWHAPQCQPSWLSSYLSPALGHVLEEAFPDR